MGHKATRRSLAALCSLPLAFLVFPALGDVAPQMSGTPRLAIGGYDTVAYHTVGKAVPGKLSIKRYGMMPAGSFPARKISISSPKIPRNTQPSMTGTAPWALRMRTATKIRLTPRLSPS